MPIYEFVNEDGVIEEHYLPMSEAPNLGAKVVIEDRLLKRIASRPRMNVKEYRVTAPSQPALDADGNLPKGCVPAPRYDRDPSSPTYGFAQFQSKKEIDEFCAKSDGRCTFGG